MTDKLADHMSYPPRMFRIERAAAYVGLSVSSFQQAVADGVFPQPVRYRGSVLWDREGLDAGCYGLRADQESENTAHAILRRGK